MKLGTGHAASQYRVWGVDHIAYGPIELPVLVAWIKDERVTADTWVFLEDDGVWVKAAQVAELNMFFRSGSGAPAVEGNAAAHAPGRDLGIKPGALRRIKIFADMEEKQLLSFLQYMEVIRYPQFAEVVRKGDHGDAMFLVLDGELRARVMVGGKESTLSTMSTGEFFGEISLLDQGPRSADVIANRDSVLLKISTASFEKILKEAPALATPFLFALSRSVCGRVRNLTKRYEDSIHFSRVSGAAR